MNKIYFLVIWLLFIFIIFSDNIVAEELKEGEQRYYSLSDRINNMEKNIATLQKYMFNIQGLDDVKNINKSISSIEEDELIEQLKNIRGEIEKLQRKTNKLEEHINEIDSDFLLRINHLNEKLVDNTEKDRILNNIKREFTDVSREGTDSFVNQQNVESKDWQNDDGMKKQEKDYNIAYRMLKDNNLKALQAFKNLLKTIRKVS